MQVHLRPHVKVRKALTLIHGIGWHVSNMLCDQLGLGVHTCVKHVRRLQWELLARRISQYYVTGHELSRVVEDNTARFVSISAYKGFRFMQGLPVRGQRTHTNAKTTRKKKKPVLRKHHA